MYVKAGWFFGIQYERHVICRRPRNVLEEDIHHGGHIRQEVEQVVAGAGTVYQPRLHHQTVLKHGIHLLDDREQDIGHLECD